MNSAIRLGCDDSSWVSISLGPDPTAQLAATVGPDPCGIPLTPRARLWVTRRLDRDHPTSGPVLFTCRHRVYGVGMFDVATVLEGDAVVTRAGASAEPTDVLVGTISACHGAASLLRLGRSSPR